MATPTSACASAGSIVGAIAGHLSFALPLLALDQIHLVFRLGLGKKVVYSGLARNHRSGQRVVAGNHDGADAHSAQPCQPVFQAALDHVLQVDHPTADAFGHNQRRTALARNLLNVVADLFAEATSLALLKEAAIASTEPLRMRVPGRFTPLMWCSGTRSEERPDGRFPARVSAEEIRGIA